MVFACACAFLSLQPTALPVQNPNKTILKRFRLITLDLTVVYADYGEIPPK